MAILEGLTAASFGSNQGERLLRVVIPGAARNLRVDAAGDFSLHFVALEMTKARWCEYPSKVFEELAVKKYFPLIAQ
jgi:hypothetical protein